MMLAPKSDANDLFGDLTEVKKALVALINKVNPSRLEEKLFDTASKGNHQITRSKLVSKIRRGTKNATALNLRLLRPFLKPLFERWGEQKVMVVLLKAKWHCGDDSSFPHCGLEWILTQYRTRTQMNSENQESHREDYNFDFTVNRHALKPEWSGEFFSLVQSALILETNVAVRAALPQIVAIFSVAGEILDETKKRVLKLMH